MALEKQVVVDQIEVTESGVVQVREATRIVEDGVVISQTYHRHCVAPGQSYANEDAKVQSICSAIHTASVVKAYEDSLVKPAV